MKIKFKKRALELRMKGFSYSEILKEVPVAKSTLSLWLRSVGLSTKQKQRLTEKRLAASSRGGEQRRAWKIAKIKRIKDGASLEIAKIITMNNQVNLWLMGIMLYWAEGSKEKEYRSGNGIVFSNSDPLMVRIFIVWLKKCLHVPAQRIKFDIYVHENCKLRVKQIIGYWSNATGFAMGKFGKIYFKKHQIKTNRKNLGDSYYGLLRIRVSKSSDLSRRIAGWIEGVGKYYCGIV